LLLRLAAIAHLIMAKGNKSPQRQLLIGAARLLGKIVLADDPVAADATCSRLIRFEPDRIAHIWEGSRFLGNASRGMIDQAGEILTPTTTPFRVVPEFQYLRAF